MDVMSMLDWASHEIELAIKDASEFEYANNCYMSAYKAFASLLEDGHSGMSIGLTMQILNRLVQGKPLTPVEDKEEEWAEAFETDDGTKCYQHKRMSSLFKEVYPDGKVSYSDNNAYECLDEDSNIPYRGAGAGKLFYEYYPITFPYSPPTKPYKIITKECLTDRKNGDFDTIAYKRIVSPVCEARDVYRAFKETENGFVEISWQEYLKRIDMHNERERKEQEGENR